ncbi:MAG: HAD family hydrolase [Verrucomicrobiota bacterium]
MRIRQLILDWSGTLVDDLPPVFATTNHVFATFGLAALTLAEFRQEFCLPVQKFYAARLPGIPQVELERVFLKQYHTVLGEITVLPHTPAFLEYCRLAGLGVYIASSVDPVTYERQMHRFGIDRYITRPYVGIVDKTQAIHEILNENQLRREETVFVGDMEHDIAAGKAGGVWTCAVLTGYNHFDTLRAAQPDWICAHLGELQERLAHG